MDDDPFSWLEDDVPDVVAWQSELDDEAASYVRQWPDFGTLVAAYDAFTPPDVPLPRIAGSGRFTYEQLPGGERRGVVLRDKGGAATVVVDPGERTIDWWYPSPGGRYVAVGLSVDGDEQSTLRLIEAQSGTWLPDEIPFASAAVVAWLPDESGFYVNAGRARDQVDSRKWVFRWLLGQAELGEPEPIPIDLPIHAGPVLSPDGRWAGLLTYPGVHTYRLSHVRDLARGGEWRRVVPAGDQRCCGVFVGDRYIAVCNDGAPRGRLVSIPLDGDADPESWQVLQPESGEVLLEVIRVGDLLALHSLGDLNARLTLLDTSGAVVARVPVPDGSSVLGMWADRDESGDDALGFQLASFTASAAEYRYDLRDGIVVETHPPDRRLEGVTVERIEAVSSDGTRIPAFVIRSSGVMGQPRPTVITAYGGFNHRWLPTWDARWAAWVDAGGVVVSAHLRGGGEFGSDWWQAGRMSRKQNTYDDLFAVAEELIAQGITTTGQLGMTGASNGGLLAGAAIVQRPDLWRAVAPVVPILDLVNVGRDPFPLSAVRLDYGDPADPGQREWLRAVSPVHGVRAGTAYPASFVMCGAVDVRCPPWHSRKLVAALRAATTSDAPILLRAVRDIGHGTGTTPASAVTWSCEPVAFLMRELGLRPRTATGQVGAARAQEAP